MRHLFISLTAILLIATDSAKAQSLTDVTSSIRDGGGWVAIAIEGGEGSYSSPRLPTLNLKLNGCVTVWDELSGSWEREATETVTGTKLLLSAEPESVFHSLISLECRRKLTSHFAGANPETRRYCSGLGSRSTQMVWTQCVSHGVSHP